MTLRNLQRAPLYNFVNVITDIKKFIYVFYYKNNSEFKINELSIYLLSRFSRVQLCVTP